MKGTLEQYLRDIDRDAEDIFSRLVKQLADIDGITEVLKAENQMLWVRKMNVVWSHATEIVNNEMIYNYLH